MLGVGCWLGGGGSILFYFSRHLRFKIELYDDMIPADLSRVFILAQQQLDEHKRCGGFGTRRCTNSEL